jgi:hypothetical protein
MTGMVAIGTALVLLGAGSSNALAANETGVVTSFTSQQSTTAAGSSANITNSLTFNSSDPAHSVKSLTITLPSGVWAEPAAAPQTCSSGQLSSNSCPSTSQVGAGSIDLVEDGAPIAAQTKLFVMRPPNPAKDLAGIGENMYVGGTYKGSITGTVDVVTPAGGQPQIVISIGGIPNQFGPSGASFFVRDVSMRLNGTTSGNAFTRLPTTCSPATTALSVTTYSSDTTGSGTDTFTPNPCNSATPPFKPTFAATATKDATDSGAQVILRVTQRTGQAAIKKLFVTIPETFLPPNPAFTSKACHDPTGATCTPAQSIGSAVARSPVGALPTARVFILQLQTGGMRSLGLVVVFPSPVPMTMSAALVPGSINFDNLPDVPLNSLTIKFDGGPSNSFLASCNPETSPISGAFTAQNGASLTLTPRVTVAGCPLPTITGGVLSGVVRHKAKLRFTVHSGVNNAPLVKKISFGLRLGLSFDAKQLKRSLKVSSVPGHHPQTFKFSFKHGRVTITLKQPASGVTIAVGPGAIKAPPTLINTIARGHIKSGHLQAKVTTADGTATAVNFQVRLS